MGGLYGIAVPGRCYYTDMMKVLIAPDKFKGSLTAVEASCAMAEGVTDSDPDTEVVTCPVADGGDGTVTAVSEATGVEPRVTEVSGPLPGQRVCAKWLLLPAGALEGEAGPTGLLDTAQGVAVIEMAQASGLVLVPDGEKDPLVTTTRGTGELIEAALDAGARQLIVGIGGSATVDGGAGMAAALGYRFLDAQDRELPPGGGHLGSLVSIDASGADRRLSGSRLLIASDVDNPLLGADGAAAVYGPQKGATPGEVTVLEGGLARLSSVMASSLGVRVEDRPGAGAAGGLGAGLMAFCGAELVSGVELVTAVVGLDGKMAGADLVLTGEGRYDGQTSRGKAPMGVAQAAVRQGIPAVILTGAISLADAGDPPDGVGLYSVCPGPMTVDEAMQRAFELLRSGTARLVRLLLLAGGIPARLR